MIDNGYVYVANFDLASFYDSIDHNVIKHYLRNISVSSDLIDFLLMCLKTWTSNTWTDVSNVIYHGHGIPQGPLSSGLLSEVVLKHIDERGGRLGKIQYIRYVDDIKIFSKTEGPLRQRLVALDLTAKEIGLFPQSAKINIRKVSDPYDEIKSISYPVELALRPEINRKKIVPCLLEMSRGGKVGLENLTRFKYLIGCAEPSYKLNKKLIEVLVKQPALSSQISNYFSRYKKLPSKSAREILNYLESDEIYHAVNANLLFAIIRVC